MVHSCKKAVDSFLGKLSKTQTKNLNKQTNKNSTKKQKQNTLLEMKSLHC